MTDPAAPKRSTTEDHATEDHATEDHATEGRAAEGRATQGRPTEESPPTAPPTTPPRQRTSPEEPLYPGPPKQQPPTDLQPVAYGVQMKWRGPWMVWILSLVTFGIYYLYWWYKIHEEMAYFDPRQRIDPVTSFVAVFLGPLIVVPPLISTFNQGERIARAQEAAGLGRNCSGILGLLLYFAFGLMMVYYQLELNRIIDRYGAAEGTSVPLYT